MILCMKIVVLEHVYVHITQIYVKQNDADTSL